MPRGKPSQNAEILEYALSHLEAERDKIQAKIDAFRQELRTGNKAPVHKNGAASEPDFAASAGTPRKKRVLSEAARKRIAAAQKRRWAEHRKKQKVE